MASIGAQSCDFLIGQPEPPALTSEVKFSMRPGVAGIVAENLGSRGGPFTLLATLFASQAAVTTWLAALAAMAGGSAVTVVLDNGQSLDKCYVGRMGGPAVEVVTREAVVESNTTKEKCVARVHGRRSAV